MEAKGLDCEVCNKELKNTHHLSSETLPRNIAVELKKNQTVKTVSSDCLSIHLQNIMQTNSFKWKILIYVYTTKMRYYTACKFYHLI